MNEHLRDIALDFSTWELYGTVEPYSIEGTPIPGLKQECYQTTIDGETISAGVFAYKAKRTHVAWGVKSEPHCSFHARADTTGNWTEVKEGCPEYAVVKKGETVAGFTIDGVIQPIL